MTRPDTRRGWVLAVCCLAQFLALLDLTVVNVALPTIGAEFGFTSAGLAWVVNAYTLGLAGFLPAWPRRRSSRCAFLARAGWPARAPCDGFGHAYLAGAVLAFSGSAVALLVLVRPARRAPTPEAARS